jgi:tellurite resistance protein
VWSCGGGGKLVWNGDHRRPDQLPGDLEQQDQQQPSGASEPEERQSDMADIRSQAEVEAESVAYVLTSTTGLDTSTYSFPYIGHWAPAGQEADVMADTAEQVLATASRL